MSSMIDYTDKAIMRMILDKMQQINPLLEIGEAITGPCATVSGGKMIHFGQDEPVPANFVSFKDGASYLPPVSSQPKQALSAITIKLHLDDIATFRIGTQVHNAALDFNLTKRTWIHPYLVDIPSRKWLEDYKRGDIIAVAVVDPMTFQTRYVQTPLTQQMIDDHSDVIFRFALSDQ